MSTLDLDPIRWRHGWYAAALDDFDLLDMEVHRRAAMCADDVGPLLAEVAQLRAQLAGCLNVEELRAQFAACLVKPAAGEYPTVDAYERACAALAQATMNKLCGGRP